jgi:hypothetical protein
VLRTKKDAPVAQTVNVSIAPLAKDLVYVRLI